jgi:hypothetical protein
MVYLKAALIGLIAAVLLAFVAQESVLEVKKRLAMRGQPSGGVGSVSAGIETAGPAFVVGFVGGVYWTLRRSRRNRLAS